MSDRAAEPKRGYVGQYAALVGAVLAVVGGVIIYAARAKLAKAGRVAEFSRALGDGRISPEFSAALTQQYIGAGVLIFGAALLLVGIVLAAFRR